MAGICAGGNKALLHEKIDLGLDDLAGNQALAGHLGNGLGPLAVKAEQKAPLGAGQPVLLVDLVAQPAEAVVQLADFFEQLLAGFYQIAHGHTLPGLGGRDNLFRACNPLASPRAVH